MTSKARVGAYVAIALALIALGIHRLLSDKDIALNVIEFLNRYLDDQTNFNQIEHPFLAGNYAPVGTENLNLDLT